MRVYALIETRDNLVKSTTSFKNQIHNIFVQHGLKLTARQVANEKNLSHNSNAADSLEKLSEFKNKGIITDAEFEAKKKQILKL